MLRYSIWTLSPHDEREKDVAHAADAAQAEKLLRRVKLRFKGQLCGVYDNHEHIRVFEEA